jgi:putative nucleotidyltransferase with HDIG domain
VDTTPAREGAAALPARPVSLNVLFVDDEPRVLEGLERMMFDVAEDWVFDTATSGEEALAKLAGGGYSIVVTDMRMPGMDGATLLARVAERHAEVVRVILSGQTDEAAIMRAAHVAHRFLAKPCGAAAIYEVVQRTQRLVARLSDPELRASIARLGALPSPPLLYLELLAVLRDGDATTEAVSRIVSRDPALSARVLQLANSAFFCRTSAPIAQVRQAIVRVGTRALGALALSSGVFQSSAQGELGVALARTQQHALQVADTALQLAGVSPVGDEAFTAALLHDVGFSALAAVAPARLREVLVGKGDQLEREREAFGTTHAEVGAHLLDLWGLPWSIVEAVGTHHTPEAIPSSHARVAALACVAAALVGGVEPAPSLVASYGLEQDIARIRRAGARDTC